jgi:hypothetical protein
MGNASGKPEETTNQQPIDQADAIHVIEQPETQDGEAERVVEVATVVADVADAVGDTSRAVADIAEAVDEIENQKTPDTQTTQPPSSEVVPTTEPVIEDVVSVTEPVNEPVVDIQTNEPVVENSYIGAFGSALSGVVSSAISMVTGSTEQDDHGDQGDQDNYDEDQGYDDEYYCEECDCYECECEPYDAPVIGHTTEGKEMKLRQDGTIDVDTSVPGAYFNEMYANCRVVKLTNESCIHNEFEFKEGLNVDINAFQYDQECGPDGLYFCTERDTEYWLDYRDVAFVWDVEIPDDARVSVYDNKIKADRFILSNKRTVIDFLRKEIKEMIYTNFESHVIIEYIKRNADYIEDFELLNEQMVNLINVDPTSYHLMPEYLRTETVREEGERLSF